MKKKILATAGVAFGLALIALGLAPAVKSAYQSICRIQQAKQLSEGVGKKKAEEVIDTLYLHSETAEPVVEQLTVESSITSEWIMVEYGPGDYYYRAEIADGDPEVVFSSFSEDAPDFLEIVSSKYPDEPLQTLSVNGEYEFRILFGHDSEETVLKNVTLKPTLCWLNPTCLRFAVEITYGASSEVVYAEEFKIKDGADRLYTVSDIGVVSISAPNQKQALLTSHAFGRSLFEIKDHDSIREGKVTLDDAILPGGAENLYEISIPFGFVAVPEKESERCSR